MTPTRQSRLVATMVGALLALAACRQDETGPLRVVAIGPAPALVNPNRDAVGPGSALLLDAVAQGLVRFDAAGEIEPALAQSWIVSDDGRRYTFRLRRTLWARGEPVTAAQVVTLLQAALARNSRNPLRDVLGAIDQIEAMTDQVLEIRLKTPRANFLQLLAQPELSILADGQGTGPYRMGGEEDGAVRLVPPPADEDSDSPGPALPEIQLRAEPAATAIARFAQGRTDFVTGGTLGDLPLLSAIDIPRDRLVFDPARGMFGLAFLHDRGLLGDPAFRRALSMAIDRQSLLARFPVPGLAPRASLLPPGADGVPIPANPEWASDPLPTRRASAAALVAGRTQGDRPRLRIALPPGLGYRIMFAHIRRDWRMIGVEAVAVAAGAQADLRLFDEVAPADLPPWYLRRFLCAASPICDRTSDMYIEAARIVPNPQDRRALLVQADRVLAAITPFITIGPPVRWSLRSPRVNGFAPNVFARHSTTELIRQE